VQRILDNAVWALLALTIGAMAVFPVTCFDVWWHLKAGEYMLTQRAVPTHDIFSYTVPGVIWVSHEWLFEVALFLVYRLAGVTGINLLNSLLVVMTAGGIWLSFRVLRVRTLIGAPLLLLASFLLSLRAFARPHLVTDLLLAVYLAVLLGFKHLPWLKRRPVLLLMLLPLHLLWANSHSGGILGIGLVLLFTLTEAIRVRVPQALEPLPMPTVRTLLMLAAGLLAVSFANPNSHRALLYSLDIAREPVFAGGVRELQSPLIGVFARADFRIALFLLLGLGLASFVMNRRQLSLFPIGVFLLCSVAALLAVRNVSIFAALAVPIIGFNLQSALEHWPTRLKPVTELRLSALLVMVSAGLFASVWIRGVHTGADLRRPAFGHDRRIFPEGAADFIIRNPVPGNVFSTMEYNGYFIWRWYPERRVFIDGRLDVYGARMFRTYGRMLWSGSETDSILKHHNVNCVILPQPPSNTALTVNYLGRTLGRHPDWSLVYWDDLAVLYVRNTPENAGLVAREWRAAKSELLGLPDSASEAGSLLSESRRAVLELPRSVLAHNLLGTALMRIGQMPEAESAFRSALSLDPASTEARLGLGITLARLGRPEQAEAMLHDAVKREPGNAIARYNLGQVLHGRRRFSEAEEQLLQCLVHAPDLVPARLLLGDVYLAAGRPQAARREWEAVLELSPGLPAALSRLGRLK
jgi:Flp pilus assembly protein TadD